VIIPHAETLRWSLSDALADWRTSTGEDRERARYELGKIIEAIQKDDAQRRASFVAAVARAKWRREAA
jgi:hypothetical protein